MEMSPAERLLNDRMGRAYQIAVIAHEFSKWDDALDGIDWLSIMLPCPPTGSGTFTLLVEELPPGWTGPVELIEGGPALLARLLQLATTAMMTTGSPLWLALVAGARVPLPIVLERQEGRRVDFGQVGLQDERG